MYWTTFGQPWDTMDSSDGPSGCLLWQTKYGKDPQCNYRACHAPTMLLRTGDVPQTREVYMFSQKSGVPWDNSRKRRNTDGPSQIQSHLRMVSFGDSQGHMVFSQILQLLLEIHALFLQHCSPLLGLHQTIDPLELGT